MAKHVKTLVRGLGSVLSLLALGPRDNRATVKHPDEGFLQDAERIAGDFRVVGGDLSCAMEQEAERSGIVLHRGSGQLTLPGLSDHG